jgi:Recombinase/Recombinase zinc beta ribbon domain
LWMASQNIHFPYPSDGRTLTSFEWRPIRYRNVISILKNPFYAGVYAYGKSAKRTTIVDGRARKSDGHHKPMDAWEVFIKDHHEGYISWAEYERNQALLAGNAYGRVGDTKSGRGGRALLAGLICCARCGRRLNVIYTGRYPRPVYRCDKPNLQLGQRHCFSFGGKRIDETIAVEMLRAVAPMAIEAAEEAERMLRDEDQDRRRIAALELQQAQYDASLAERRYAACDPDNRLIAAQKAWETALQCVERRRERLDRMQTPDANDARPDFTGMADDLSAAWKAPRTMMRTRQRLVRTLITEIIADVDAIAGEIVLVIHWKGGQHSELRVLKPKTGEHGCHTPEQGLAVMRSMAGRWSDQDIAASLNRMGMPTGQGKTWTAHRVSSLRRVHGIHSYRSAEKSGEWLTLRDAAAKLGVQPSPSSQAHQSRHPQQPADHARRTTPDPCGRPRKRAGPLPRSSEKVARVGSIQKMNKRNTFRPGAVTKCDTAHDDGRDHDSLSTKRHHCMLRRCSVRKRQLNKSLEMGENIDPGANPLR